MADSNTGASSRILRTILAMILAPVGFVLVSIAVTAFVYFTQTIFTVIRPSIIEFFAVIVGAFAGMYASRWACDAWVKDYSKRSVFGVFAVLFLAVLAFELVYVPPRWGQITSYAQLIAIGIAAYLLFWRDDVEPLSS